MRALLFDGKQLQFDPRKDEPKLAPGEALIRPLLAGICSTDIEICRGYMNHTGVLGHEFVGIVELVHADCDDKSKKLAGSRVVGSINCVCGRCDLCKRGLSSHCRNRTVLGIAGRDGCFADRFTLPVRNLIVVPDEIENEQAVFVEPLAAACQLLQQLHVEGRPFITVLGDGRLGLLVAQVLTTLNATVRVVGKHPEKLARCEKWGIKHRLLADNTPHADQDIVVDCTGSASGLQLAMKMVRPRGKIVLKTTVADQAGVDLSPLVINEIELIGSRCGPFPHALSMLAEGRVDVTSLISRRIKIEQGADAMTIAQQPDVLKVLLEF
ncbi:MAG: MDR/zinc-dependent alcohol dehydrogenase-like family protein [Phycisphaerales bacterium]